MTLKLYALVAVALSVTLQVLLTLPPQDLYASETEIVPDTVELSRSLPQDFEAPEPATVTTFSSTLGPKGQKINRDYTVQEGDSLPSIALEHYGDTSAFLAIYAANRDVLSSPGAITPGLLLRLP